MLILKLIGGYILILFGSLVVFGEVVEWRDFGHWEAIKAQGISYLPLSAYLTPIIGLLLLYFGSFVIVKTFKGHLKRNNTITIKSKPLITSIVYFLILIQCCIVIFQIHELARYYKDIAEHEATMSYEGNPEVTGPYYLGVAGIPSLSQLILLPTIWGMLIYRSKYTLNGTYVFLLSCWLNCFSWCASITAIVYSISAYD